VVAIAASFLQFQSSFGVELSVLVQNVQFMILVGGTTEEQIDRATKYGDLLVGLGDDIPDVIGFTETFIKEPSDILVGKLNTTHPHQLRSFPDPLPIQKPLDSGLTLLSKYPIEAHDFRMFTEANGLDALAAKGVLVALLRLPSSFAVVSVTHQNAGGTDAVFTSQLGTARDLMKDFVARNIPPSAQKYTAVVMMGDYNIDAGSDTYREMLSTLAYRTEDPHILLNPGEDGFTSPSQNPTRRIDYIFKADVIEEGGCSFSYSNVTSYGVNDLVVEDLLSDHLGVAATISIAEKMDGVLSSQVDSNTVCENSAKGCALWLTSMQLFVLVVSIGYLL